MIATNSLHLTTSVLVPDDAQVEPEVRQAAERVTRRIDGSVVLVIRASTIDVAPDEVFATLESAWERALECLTASPSPTG